MTDLAIVHCRQLVTLAGPPGARSGAAMRSLAIIADGALRIRGGRIAAVGPRAEIERSLSEDTAIVDAGGRIVLPGFIDAHTHPVFAGSREAEFERRVEGATYAAIAASGGGIGTTVRQTREASAATLLAAARRYQDWFLSGGTTTIEAKSGYGLSLDAEIKILKTIRQLKADGRLRYVPTFLGAHEIPGEYRGRIGDYVDLVIQEMLPRVAEDNLAEYCDVFCEPNVFPVEQARTVLRAAQALGLGLRMHADQFSADYGSLLAAELHAATADHLEASTPAALAALHAPGVQPVLLPPSGPPVRLPRTAHIGTPPPPAAPAALDAAGVHPGLLPPSVYPPGGTRYPAARR